MRYQPLTPPPHENIHPDWTPIEPGTLEWLPPDRTAHRDKYGATWLATLDNRRATIIPRALIEALPQLGLYNRAQQHLVATWLTLVDITDDHQ